MNPLQLLIYNKLKEVYLSKPELVRSLGYKNVSKGIRNLESFLESGDPKGFPFWEQIPEVLNLSPETFNSTLKQTVLANEEELRKKFKPSVVLRFDRVPTAVWTLALAPSIWKTEIPEHIQSLPYEEELSEVVEIAKGLDLAYRAKGFTYFRKFDESIDFDKEGAVVNKNKEYILEPVAYLTFKKMGKPDKRGGPPRFSSSKT